MSLLEYRSGSLPAGAPALSGPRAGNLGLAHLIGAGLLDSTGLAFGWTIVMLVVAQQKGLAAAALMTSSSLVGMALAAPFSAWLSSRCSPRHLLQRLAVAEALTRASLFAIMAVGGAAEMMAPIVVLTNMIAWTAYAAMRAQVSQAGTSGDVSAAGTVNGANDGAGLTWYAAAILASEAVAAGGASLLIVHPSPLVLLLVGAVYTCSLAPQWWVGAHADPEPPALARTVMGARTTLRLVISPVIVGALVYFLAAGPALMAAVLAFERYGAVGVMVAAVSFAVGSLGSARLQARVAGISSAGVAACLLAAAMIGCWTILSLGLPALAASMLCVGLTQCCIEGDLDARTLACLRAEPSSSATALAIASSSRAIGGAAAVAALPAVISAVSLPVAAASAGGVLLAAAAILAGLARLPRAAASSTIATMTGNRIPAVEHVRRGRLLLSPRVGARTGVGDRSGRSPEQFLALVDTLAHLARGLPAATTLGRRSWVEAE